LPDSNPARPLVWWHLLILFVISASYESLFVQHGMNLLDEGWVLYGAKRLHEGHQLYTDVVFVFPPGHILPAWLGYWWEPPGIVATRTIDAALNTSLCLALYALGRKIMPSGYALFGAALLALTAPYSHMAHFLFGYRYLVFAVLALIAFARRLETGQRGWMCVAGALTGAALCFRLTPAFAVSCAVGVGLLASSRDWRDWLRDGSLYAIALIAVVAPVAGYFIFQVGPEWFWSEVVVRPIAMTDAQSLPVPDLSALPLEWRRRPISKWFTALQFRLYALMYLGYWLSVGLLFARAVWKRRPFPHVMLLTLVVWGGVYFFRVMGRSDIAHLESAIPPVCMLIAYFWYVTLRGLAARFPGWHSTARQVAVCTVIFAAWILLFGVDTYLTTERRGEYPIEVTDPTIFVNDPDKARILTRRVERIQDLTGPDDTIFDLSVSPLFHLLTDRGGIAHSGLVMPGSFRDTQEERAVVAQLRNDPPTVVIAPLNDFDGKPSRSVGVTAPRLTRWVMRHYEALFRSAEYLVLTRRDKPLSRGVRPKPAGQPEPR
jgi:hypothetical protein